MTPGRPLPAYDWMVAQGSIRDLRKVALTDTINSNCRQWSDGMYYGHVWSLKWRNQAQMMLPYGQKLPINYIHYWWRNCLAQNKHEPLKFIDWVLTYRIKGLFSGANYTVSYHVRIAILTKLIKIVLVTIWYMDSEHMGLFANAFWSP